MKKESMIKNLKFWGIMLVSLFTIVILLEDSGVLSFLIGYAQVSWVETLAAVAVIVALTMLVFISPIGDSIAAKMLSAEKYDENIPEFNEIYREVLEDAAKKDASLRNKKLYLINDLQPNAFVSGRKNIYLTLGFSTLPPECMQGIIAHELGHIYYKHTLINQLANAICLLIYGLFKGLLFLLNIVCIITEVFARFPIIGFVARLSLKLFNIEVEAADFMCNLCREELIKFSQRNSIKKEFAADNFAAEIGYGDELEMALEYLNNNFDLNGNEIPSETHPLISERIKKLEERKENYNG